MERALVDTVITEVEMGKRAENGFKKDTFVRMAQAANLKNYQKPVGAQQAKSKYHQVNIIVTIGFRYVPCWLQGNRARYTNRVGVKCRKSIRRKSKYAWDFRKIEVHRHTGCRSKLMNGMESYHAREKLRVGQQVQQC